MICYLIRKIKNKDYIFAGSLQPVSTFSITSETQMDLEFVRNPNTSVISLLISLFTEIQPNMYQIFRRFLRIEVINYLIICRICFFFYFNKIRNVLEFLFHV